MVRVNYQHFYIQRAFHSVAKVDAVDGSIHVLLGTSGMQGCSNAGLFFIGPFLKSVLAFKMARVEDDQCSKVRFQ